MTDTIDPDDTETTGAPERRSNSNWDNTEGVEFAVKRPASIDGLDDDPDVPERERDERALNELDYDALHDKAVGYRGRVQVLEERVDALLADAAGHILDVLKGRQGDHESDAVLQRFIELVDGKRDDLRRQIAQIKANGDEEYERAERLADRLSEARERIRALKAKVERLEAKIGDMKAEWIEPPSDDEIRAAYKLGIGIKDLRRWQRAGKGPQPPYDNLDAWHGWVEANT